MSGGGALGALNISLLLETVQFQQEMTRAAYLMNRNVGEMVNSVNGAGQKIGNILKGVAGAVGVGLSVDAFVGIVKGSIDAQEQLGRLAEKAQMTASQLSTMREAARLSNTDLGAVADMSTKLSKSLVESSDGTSKQAAVLRKMGITAQDVERMLQNPADGLFILSKRAAQFNEDGYKSTALMMLLGKGAGEATPFLKQLAEQKALVATRTDEEVRAARDFNDKLTLMQMRSEDLKKTLAIALLPTLNDIVDAFTKAQNGATNAKSVLDQLSSDGSIKTWAREAALAIGTVAESILAVVRVGRTLSGSVEVIVADLEATVAASNAPKMKPFGSLGFTPDEAKAANDALDAAVARRNQVLADANKRYSDLWNERGTIITDALRKQFEASDAAASGQRSHMNADRAVDAFNASQNAGGKKPSIGNIEDGAAAAAELKKALEGRVRELELAIKSEEQLLTQREQLLSRFYAEGELSISEYFGRLNDVRKQEISNVASDYDKIIAEYKRASDAAQSRADKIEYAEKAIAVAVKKQDFISDALQKERIAFYDAGRAAQDYADMVLAAAARAASVQGDSGRFAGELFKAQNRVELKQAENDPQLAGYLAIQKQAAEVQAKMDDSQRRVNAQLSLLNSAQSAVDLQHQTMQIGEIEALNRKSALNAAIIDQLKVQIALQEELARSLPAGSTAQLEALARVAQFKGQIASIAAATDLLGDKIQRGIGDGFADHLTKIIERTESLRAGIKNLDKDLTHMLLQMAINEAKTAIFGKNGPLGGIGSWLGSLLSGGAGAGAGPTPAWPTGADAGIPAFASGIDFVPHDMLAVVHKGERVVRAEDNRSGRFGAPSIVIHQTLPAGTSRQTRAQYANELRRALIGGGRST